MTIIAIDGPSGSGKSTIAKTLAELLDLPYLDTGAMYRAVGLVALRQGLSTDDERSLGILATELDFSMLDERIDGKLRPRVEILGQDATAEIRTPEVSQAASAIAVHPEVREHLVLRQREWVSKRGGAVVEGRDIGSVVFPKADLKVFLTAHHAERVRRRKEDAHAVGFAEMSATDVARELSERDERDTTRDTSPLTVPDGSLVLDTSDFSVEEVVSAVLDELRVRSSGSLPSGTSRG